MEAHFLSDGGDGASSGFGTGLVCEPYQLYPLRRIRELPLPRLLIADDTGMGKTVETGLILAEQIRQGRGNRILVVAPPALLEHWQEKLRDHFHLRFDIVDAAVLTGLEERLPQAVNPWTAADWAITSMDFIRQPAVLRRLARCDWDTVVIDECHHVAFRGTQSSLRHRMACELSRRCRSLILLSATPHDGSTEGFRSLLKMLDPLATPGEDLITREVRPLVVRRLKADVSSEVRRKFAGRTVTEMPVPLSPNEAETYELLRQYTKGPDGEGGLGIVGSILLKRWASSPMALKRTLSARRKAIRRALRQETPESAPLFPDLEVIQETASLESLHREEALVRSIGRSVSSSSGDSKLLACQELIASLWEENPNEKIVVFTEYRDTLAYLRQGLDMQGQAGRTAVYHGGLRRDRRRTVLRRFLSGSRMRLLLATDAAGEGIDIQHGCNVLLHYELPWNPNRMEQRNGRVDRYGQTRTARIFYFHRKGFAQSAVLAALQRKLEKIRQELGSASDVLGALEGDAFEAILNKGGDEKEMLVAVQRLVARGEKMPLAAFRKRKGEMEGVMDLDSEGARLETFVTSALPLFGGRAVETRGAWRLQTPPGWARKGAQSKDDWIVAPRYDRVKFRLGGEPLTGLTVVHPLVRLVLDYARGLCGEESPLPRTCLCRAQDERGIYFVCRFTFTNDRGRSVEAKTAAFFVPRTGHAVAWDWPRLGAGLSQLQLIEENDCPWEDDFAEFHLKAEKAARAWALARREDLAKKRKAWARERLNSLGRYRTGRLAHLGKILKPRSGEESTVFFDEKRAKGRLREAMERLEVEVLMEADLVEDQSRLAEEVEIEWLGFCLCT
jgi:ERCC4-related helicase